MPNSYDDRAVGAPKYVDWPPAVTKEPDFPELEPMKVDLACDAMVYRPAFEDDL